MAEAIRVHRSKARDWLVLSGVSGAGVGLVHGVPGIVLYVENPVPGLEDRVRRDAPGVPIRIEVTGGVYAVSSGQFSRVLQRCRRWIHRVICG
jgi:hypothetical protein